LEFNNRVGRSAGAHGEVDDGLVHGRSSCRELSINKGRVGTRHAASALS
jgi:hypothetical protein